MTHIISNCEQRSAEWYELRKGVITASSCEKILVKSKQPAFLWALLAEKLGTEKEEFFINEYMQRGIDKEDEAREAYEKITGNKVSQVGFVFKDSNKWVGCSPDGLVGDDGLLEIKCPKTSTHISYLVDGPPKNYIDQMQFQMYCFNGERQYCDFVTWDDRMEDPDLVTGIFKVKLDIAKQTKIDDAVQVIIKEFEARLKYLYKFKPEKYKKLIT